MGRKPHWIHCKVYYPLGIQSPNVRWWAFGVFFSPPSTRSVFRFHETHSQKMILGIPIYSTFGAFHKFSCKNHVDSVNGLHPFRLEGKFCQLINESMQSISVGHQKLLPIKTNAGSFFFLRMKETETNERPVWIYIWASRGGCCLRRLLVGNRSPTCSE